jgi:hypothetical protein
MKNIICGHRVRNKLLLALPDNERAAIFTKLEFVSLTASARRTVSFKCRLSAARTGSSRWPFLIRYEYLLA